MDLLIPILIACILAAIGGYTIGGKKLRHQIEVKEAILMLKTPSGRKIIEKENEIRKQHGEDLIDITYFDNKIKAIQARWEKEQLKREQKRLKLAEKAKLRELRMLKKSQGGINNGTGQSIQANTTA
jgi:hypothetical protein